jgi:hypothetical protein
MQIITLHRAGARYVLENKLIAAGASFSRPCVTFHIAIEWKTHYTFEASAFLSNGFFHMQYMI